MGILLDGFYKGLSFLLSDQILAIISILGIAAVVFIFWIIFSN